MTIKAQVCPDKSVQGYWRGCRCKDCTAAHRRYMRAYKKRYREVGR